MYLMKKMFMSLGFVSSLFVGMYMPEVNISTVHAASIMGVVTDENGDAIKDAVVKIKSKGSKKKTVSTDSDGLYEVTKLKKGKHKLTVESVGYETISEVVTISKDSEEAEKDITLDFASYTKTNDTDTLDAAVSAFKEIGTLRKEDTIDGDAIEAAYGGELQDLVQEMDTENSLTLDSDITDAIEDIKNDNEPKLAAQVIDKTIQRAFYLAVLEYITDARDDFNEDSASELSQYWDQAYAAYQALVGTADRENKVLTSDRTDIETGSNPNLEDQITVAFIRGQKALKKKHPEEDEITVGVQRQVIRLSLVRAFYIAVLREVEAVLDYRDTDTEKALEVQKEGEVYYRIIESFVSEYNSTGNETIKSQLTGDVAGIVADTVVSELSKGFIGHVTDELESNESALNEGDRLDAVVTAEEALLYSNVFLEDVELRLGAEQRGEMEEALDSLRNASDKVNTLDAETARQTVTSVIADYEKELL